MAMIGKAISRGGYPRCACLPSQPFGIDLVEDEVYAVGRIF